MNRRAFLGSGLMSLFVGVFALLMGGGLPRPKQREGKVVKLDNSPLSAKDQSHIDSLDLRAAEAELGITPAPDYLRILKPWDGKPLQEAEPIAHTAYGYYDSDPRVNGPEDIEAFREAWEKALSNLRAPGYAVSVPAPGRQFGLG